MPYIDRDKLKDDIAVLFERNEELIDEWLANCVDDVIDEQPTADVVEVPRWTSVDERLPEPNQLVGKTRKYYLVQDEYGDMLTASYNKRADGFIYWEQMYDIEPLHYEVVAWMELPEPYRKETEDGAKN